jgi:hypothetical protein
VLKWPKKYQVKADAEKRKAFVVTYAGLRFNAQATGAKVFFVDEAHFRADIELRAKWILRDEPALADSASPCPVRKRPTIRASAWRRVQWK